MVENKSGRQALLQGYRLQAMMTFAQTGTETIDYMIPGSRIAQFGFIFWICNDLAKYDEFITSQPDKLKD